jgi:hypothetical protein
VAVYKVEKDGSLVKVKEIDNVHIPASDQKIENIFHSEDDPTLYAFFPNANNKGYCRSILDANSL